MEWIMSWWTAALFQWTISTLISTDRVCTLKLGIPCKRFNDWISIHFKAPCTPSPPNLSVQICFESLNYGAIHSPTLYSTRLSESSYDQDQIYKSPFSLLHISLWITDEKWGFYYLNTIKSIFFHYLCTEKLNTDAKDWSPLWRVKVVKGERSYVMILWVILCAVLSYCKFVEIEKKNQHGSFETKRDQG